MFVTITRVRGRNNSGSSARLCEIGITAAIPIGVGARGDKACAGVVGDLIADIAQRGAARPNRPGAGIGRCDAG